MLYFFAIIGLLGLTALAYIAVGIVFKKAMQHTFLAQERPINNVYLTFDDGPDPICTTLILDILKSHNAKASFFVMGSRAQKHPELIKRMLTEGHSVGEHSYAHPFPWTSNPIETFNDLQKCARVLDAFAPKDFRLFRPQYGKLNLASVIWLLSNKRKLAFWNNDPQDYAKTTATEISQSVISHLNTHKIILLHDGRQDDTQHSESLSKALIRILEHGQQKHYHFVAL